MPLDQQGFQIETKPDVFSLEELTAWLEKQNPDEEYCWGRAGSCLFHRYGEYIGLTDLPLASVYSQTIHGFGFTFMDMPIEPPMIAITYPHTYGAALDRARKLLAERRS